MSEYSYAAIRRPLERRQNDAKEQIAEPQHSKREGNEKAQRRAGNAEMPQAENERQKAGKGCGRSNRHGQGGISEGNGLAR